MNYKNILVTGGSGFIGSNFINYIFNKYNNLNIVNIDSLTYAGNINNTNLFLQNKNYNFIKGDINDTQLLTEIFNEFKIDGVVNFAAESHVDNSIVNPDIFIKSNINGVLSLLKVCNKFWMKSPFQKKEKYSHARFHQISTDEIYGSIDKGSFTESSSFLPNSPYSASKASADLIVRSFNKTYGLDTTISVSSNNFGHNQHSEKFIPKIINCLMFNKPIPLYGDGKNIRDWIYVKDNCIAIDKIFNFGKSGNSYNVGANNEISNIDLVQLISKIIGVKAKIKYVEDRFGHDKRYSMDCTKISKYFNLIFKDNFELKLKEYINDIK